MTNGANCAELITLINTGLTFITVVTSIVSLHLAKKQIKQEGKKNWMFHNTANGDTASTLVHSISETVN